MGRPCARCVTCPWRIPSPLCTTRAARVPAASTGPDKPAELYWTEAQDGGDPRVEVSPRDITFTADMHGAGPDAPGVPTFQTDLRYGGISWAADGLGLLYESWYKTRTIRAWAVDTFGRPDRPPRLLYDRDYEDSYDDPGSPLSRRMPDGSYLLAKIEGPLPEDGWVPAKPPAKRKAKENGEAPTKRAEPGPLVWETGVTLLLEGDGASDAGDKPFVDLLNLDTGATRRLWECTGQGALERPGSIISDAKASPITLDTLKILLSRETPSDNPQYYSLELGGSSGCARGGSAIFPTLTLRSSTHRRRSSDTPATTAST